MNTDKAEGFAETRLTVTPETATAAVQAHATAAVQAKYLMAMRNPRDMHAVEVRLLAECQRPGFAFSARYSRPVGGGQNASGWSIRFAEAAYRALGNVEMSSSTIYDDATTRIVSIGVCCYESNVHIGQEVSVQKTIERSKAEGREVVSERTNSKGGKVFIVRATDDEIAVKEAIARSKGWRAVLRLVPGDVLDNCEAMIAKTIASMPADQQVERMLMEFQRMSINAVDVQAYLGHPMLTKGGDGRTRHACSAAEIEELRGVWSAIRDGETTWNRVMADRDAGTREQQQNIAAEKIRDLMNAQKPPTPSEPPAPPAQPAESCEAAPDIPPVPAPASPAETDEQRFDREQAAQQDRESQQAEMKARDEQKPKRRGFAL